MRTKTVGISNIVRLAEAGKALLTSATGLPRMGLVYSESGYGKTTALAWLATRQNGVFVRALATTTPSSLLESICKELCIAKRQKNVSAVEDIVQALWTNNRPLFIDEADYLISHAKLIETLRDIGDLAQTPVILIGMKGIERRITERPQLYNRIAQWVEFQAATIDDTKLLAKELAEVEIKEDLVRQLHQQSTGVVRLIVIGLARIEQVARSAGLTKIGLAEWPQGTELLLGQGPRKRLAAVG